MDYAHLGRSGLRVSRLCLGTMNFGPLTAPSDAHAIMDRAHELGINFFDTANAYGRRPSPPGEVAQNDGLLSALNIRQACDASLRRLKTDHIDLYQMHHVDLDTPWDEIWQAMEVLVTQGKVVYVGSSNFAGWHLAQANDAAAD